jgi:HEAT repeat protein
LASGQTWSGDPVEDLRRILKAPLTDLQTRDRNLKDAVSALQSLGELRRAVVLQDWRDADPNEEVAVVDRVHRAVVLERFARSVRDVLHWGDTTSRLAVLNMLAEVGPSVRGHSNRKGLAGEFASDLVPLLRQSDSSIREATARTLGHIAPDPQAAVPALGDLLRLGNMFERQAAAEGLTGMVQVVTQLATRNPTMNGVEASRVDVVAVARPVALVAATGLRDSQPEVRRRSLEAVAQAAEALHQLVQTHRAVDEMTNLADYQRQVSEERAELLPLVLALKDQGPALTHALSDPDGQVRFLARQALENMTDPQLRLLERAASANPDERLGSVILRPVPYPRPPSPSDPLRDGLHMTVLVLAEGMKDPDPHARRAIIDVLETLGPAAAPSAPALVAALKDKDPFVRWSAARTLGKISPEAAATAVPALAHLLSDRDLDVRLTAVAALTRYGSAAAQAVPDLVALVSSSDAELRVAAVRALGAVGTSEVQRTLPAIRTALIDGDPRVRLAAAEELGRFGPAARLVADDLRQTLQDSNEDVRKAAGEALLAITGPVRN